MCLRTGKGRGVVATADLKVGDVVLVTPPLAWVQSELQQRPNGDLVVDTILERRLFSSKWLSVLYDGSARSCKSLPQLQPSERAGPDSAASVLSPPPEPLLAEAASTSSAPTASAAAPAAAAPQRKGFLASKAASRKAGRAGRGGAATAAGPSSSELLLPDRREQTRIAKIVKVRLINLLTASARVSAPSLPVRWHFMDPSSTRISAPSSHAQYNCFGDDAEDPAGCATRGEPPRGHIGLWPGARAAGRRLRAALSGRRARVRVPTAAL